MLDNKYQNVLYCTKSSIADVDFVSIDRYLKNIDLYMRYMSVEIF